MKYKWGQIESCSLGYLTLLLVYFIYSTRETKRWQSVGGKEEMWCQLEVSRGTQSFGGCNLNLSLSLYFKRPSSLWSRSSRNLRSTASYSFMYSQRFLILLERNKEDCVVFLLIHVILSFDSDGRVELLGGGSLLINNLTEEDAGIYTCMAENGNASIEAQAQLTLQGNILWVYLEQSDRWAGKACADKELSHCRCCWTQRGEFYH